jgi:putative lipoic acid-binding regulatory protein
MSQKKSKEFYDRLTEQLAEDRSWPAPYMFKFIVPGRQERIDAVCEFFEDSKADIRIKSSSKGSYSSISITITMDSPEAVVQKYKQVSIVEDVISL